MAPLGQALPNSRDLPPNSPPRLGFDEPCFRDSDEIPGRAGLRRRAGLRGAEGLARLDQPADCPTRRSPTGGFPTPDGRVRITLRSRLGPAGLPVPPWESVASAPTLAARYPLAMISPPARNFLNSTFVNVSSLRDIEGEPGVEIHPRTTAARAARRRRAGLRLQRPRPLPLPARVSTRARPGVVNGLGIWWRKLGLRGTNVNELTHQRLTDLGRAPCFYDCLVQGRLARAG